jgi:hypothetical protein
MRNHSPFHSIQVALKQHHREIRLTKPPLLLLEVIERTNLYCHSSGATVSDALNAVCRGYRNDYIAWKGFPPDHSTPEPFTFFDRVLCVGAFSIMLFECLCASVLAAMTLAVSPRVAVLVGIGITVVFTMAMKAVWHLYIAPDEEQPRRALANLYSWLLPVFAVWTAALVAALLLPRLIDESTPALNLCFNIVMSVLTVVSPVLCGILFTAGGLYSWARTHTRHYHRLTTLRGRIIALLAECERLAIRCGVRPGADANRQYSNRQSSLHGVIQLILAALLLTAHGHGQTRGEFWFDDSTSPLHAALVSGEDQFFHLLSLPEPLGGIHSWSLFRFSQDAANAFPAAALNVDPFVEPACKSDSHLDELTQIFRRPQTAAKRNLEKDCAQSQRQARIGYDQIVFSKIAAAKSAFDRAPLAKGSCTALIDLLNRLRDQPPAQAPAEAIILTDGIESCMTTVVRRLEKPLNGVCVLMVIVPPTASPRGRTPWRIFELRREWWKKVAPWIRVIPASQFTAVASYTILSASVQGPP